MVETGGCRRKQKERSGINRAWELVDEFTRRTTMRERIFSACASNSRAVRPARRAVVAGVLLTAIPNWTGRMPLQGRPLVGLLALWAAGAGVLVSARLGLPIVAALDFAFSAVLAAVIARKIIAGHAFLLPILAAGT
jgi:hypothetical protein